VSGEGVIAPDAISLVLHSILIHISLFLELRTATVVRLKVIVRQ